MDSKSILATVLIVTLLIVFLQPGIQEVEGVTTIYILPDGTVSPSDAPIQRPDDLVYVLTDNITTTGGGNGIVILKDNVVLDGAGYTIHQSHEMNGLDVSGRRNVTIRNICVEMFDVGIYLFDSNNCSITGCIVGNNTANVWLEQSSNNTLSENTVKYAGVHGIVLRTSSENNTIAQNQLQTNPTGIMLWRSSRYNSVFANHVNGSDTAGIYMCNSSRSDIFDNNVSNSDNGLRLDTYSYENKIHGNTIEHSTHWGIYIGSSSNNTFYQNNLLDNPSQVVGDSSVNLWDNGSQGNYWSDYNGTDANHDGIGDTAYAINANNSDRYPLIEPYVVEKKHQVRLLSVNASRRMVRSGNPMMVDVQVMNTGDYTETFKVTIYAGKTVIGTRTVTLGAHSVQTVPFLWQTAGFKIKNYVISSVVTPVSSEMQIINNGLSDLNAVQVMGDGCCIVVAGTKLNDEIRNVIAHGAVTVYQTLREAGYSDDDIYFMMQPEFNPDVDGDGQNDVDNNSTSQNLQWAIEEWAEHRVSPNAPLILFIFTHGSLNYLSIREYEGVSSYQLATWIGNLENATNAQVHFFLSACHSGSFIDDLSKTGRVIVTSCNGTESSWVSHGRWEIFGETFWNQIKSGHSVGFSFLVACDLMPPDSYVGGPYQQTPLLDDNGDGVGHTFPEYDGDGYAASSLHIGRCEWPYPWISYATAKQTLPWPPSSSVNLAAQVENETNLAHVRAYMQPPDWMPSPPNDTLGVLDFEWFEMMDPDHDGNWTVDIPMANFTNHAFGPSNFTFFIPAEEEDNNTATPRTVNVEFTETGSPSADVLKPIVNVERPLEETVVHNVICVNGSVSDDACVEKVELYVDDNLYDTLDLQPYSTSYFEFNLNTAMLANGARNILVKAFDASDNSANQSL
ncbi:right-handed parallel beta-helix repeat-containing protein, partial [Candidatus Bathyarchaeota archaeon]|nr:right-handed parallel beta-helix repeat-containing protein [Candidatus Bathyarchaeota archaeon]